MIDNELFKLINELKLALKPKELNIPQAAQHLIEKKMSDFILYGEYTLCDKEIKGIQIDE